MKNSMFRKRFTIIVFLLFMSFIGCAKITLNYEKTANHKNITEDSEYGKIDMVFKSLDGEDIRSFKSTVGKEYRFIYKYKVESGKLKIEFTDSKGNIIAKIPDAKDIKADEGENENIIIGEIGGILNVKSVDEKIRIIITGKGAAGYIKLNW